jgi:hypothetical protein
MSYQRFCKEVSGYSIGQLRCDDAAPTEGLLALMDRIGLEQYERYVLRLERAREAHGYEMRAEAQAACTRATDRVVSWDAE